MLEPRIISSLFFGFALCCTVHSGYATTPTPPLKSAKTPEAKASPYRFIEVNVRIRLQHHHSIRTRQKDFIVFRYTPKHKKIVTKHGPVSLTLHLYIQPPGKLSVNGHLQLLQQRKSIVIKGQRLQANTVWKFKAPYQLKTASAQLQITAQLRKETKSPGKSRYHMKFTKVHLHRLLHKLAEFNRITLQLDPALPNRAGISIKLKANTRRKLIDIVCQRFQLRCLVQGKRLKVSKR